MFKDEEKKEQSEENELKTAIGSSDLATVSSQGQLGESWRKSGDHFNFQDMSFVSRLWGHFKTVMRHKIYVADGCFRIGLIRQGIFHDMSKFSPSEFWIGVKYFDGHRSPNAIERINKDGLSTAWLHHKGRNRHHFEYWIDYSIKPGLMVYGNRMPMKYVAEMVCDRRAACMAYNIENYTQRAAWDHYQITKTKVIMDHDTRVVLENALWIMKEDGEDACFEFLRKLLTVTKGRGYTAKSLGLSDIKDV